MSILVAEAKQQINGCITAAANAAMADGSLEKAELTEFSVSAPGGQKPRRLRRKRRNGVGKAFQERAARRCRKTLRAYEL